MKTEEAIKAFEEKHGTIKDYGDKEDWRRDFGVFCSGWIACEAAKGQPICKLNAGRLEFFKVFPNVSEPVLMGYVFTQKHSQKELTNLVNKWYAGIEIELLT